MMMKKSCSLVAFLLLLLVISLMNEGVATPRAIPLASLIPRSSYGSKYTVQFHAGESPYDSDGDQESIVMSGKNGKRFLCLLPKEDTTKNKKSVTEQNTTNLIMETENQVKLKTPDELLGVLKNVCLYRLEEWWSYEFCYQKKLWQFHVEENKVVEEFVLGIYDKDATIALNQKVSDALILKDPHSKEASQRYHPHKYTNGTMCELTNQPRETEVRFVCSESSVEIISITELSTCKYAITLGNPMLCKNPLFQKQKSGEHTINCNELPKDTKSATMEEGSFKDKQ